jgi:uridine kinase
MQAEHSLVLGIAGGTGSGKSTIADEVVAGMGPGNVAILQQDSYYRDLSALPLSERARMNFDHPDALDWPLLREQVGSLRAGRAVEKPVYDFRNHSRLAATVRVEPRPLLILEGILIFHDPELRAAMDIKVFVDVDPDIRFIRRLERDIRERGRSLDSVTQQYLSTVRPMHMEFVEPARRHADIIIPGGGQNRVAMQTLLAILRALR